MTEHLILDTNTNENPEQNSENQKFLMWLKNELARYENIFDLSDDDLRDCKVLEIGAYDRRFAATCNLNNLTREVYSLEPALSDKEREGFASKEDLQAVMEGLPPDVRAEVKKRTIVALAENIPITNQSFDYILNLCP